MFKNNIFKGQRALITGGGSGIGYKVAEMLLQHGATVIIASRTEEKLKKAAESLSAHGEVHYSTCDIRELSQVKVLADFIEEKVGGLDILLNNAGGQFPSPAEQISENGWNAVINNNLNGTWFVTQTMAKRFFIAQKSGVITMMIANIFRGFPGMAHTGAARAGVDNLTKTLSVEWSQYGIRVNAVAPGIIKTKALEQYPKEIMDGIAKGIPMKRLGKVEEVAQLTVFLCSKFATYITGETVYIDGGQRLWGDIYQSS